MSLQPSLRILRLPDAGDFRGSSFTAPISSLQFLGSVRDMHIADIGPGAVRGNHFHEHRREVLCIRYTDSWSVHWDSGANTEIQRETFSGSGLVLVEIEPLISHAVRNDGSSPICMVALSDRSFDPRSPDSQPRKVI